MLSEIFDGQGGTWVGLREDKSLGAWKVAQVKEIMQENPRALRIFAMGGRYKT